MNLWNFIIVLLHLVDELCNIKGAIAAPGLDNLGLLFYRKVVPLEAWTNNIPKESQDFIVRNGARVGKVVDSSLEVLCENYGCGKKIVEDGVGLTLLAML